MHLFRLPAWGKLVALFLVGTPVVLAGSYFLKLATAEL
jgi:hypothetical protein